MSDQYNEFLNAIAGKLNKEELGWNKSIMRGRKGKRKLS